MNLEIGVALGQDLLDHQLRERAQQRELDERPALAPVEAGQALVEEAALVVEAVVVGDALVAEPARGVVLVTDHEVRDAALAGHRQARRRGTRHGPQPDRILVRPQPREVLAHERQVAQHPVEHPIGRGPDPRRRLGRLLAQEPVGVERRVPVAPGFVDEDRVRLEAELAEQAVAQQAVLAAARRARRSDCRRASAARGRPRGDVGFRETPARPADSWAA